MGTRDKRLKKWKNNTPTSARKDEVIAVLDYFFKNKYSCEGTSHIVVRHDDLIKFEDYKPHGEISIPVKGGQKVRGIYLKKIIEAIEILDLWDEKGENNG